MTMRKSHSLLIPIGFLCLLAEAPFEHVADAMADTSAKPGFSFDCDLTPSHPCRKLAASAGGKGVRLEPSSAAWSERYGKFIVVSDNYNDLSEQGAAHFVIVYFDLQGGSPIIPVKPLLTPEQAEAFPLYDLEGITAFEDRLYAIGSLALHGKNPDRDRWERNHFVKMEFVETDGRLGVTNLSHIAKRWPSFRDWLISKSGYEWTGREIRGRAEGEGINVEALSVTSDGNFVLGFRGPLLRDGGTLALEIKPPASPNGEPALVRKHVIPQVESPHIPKGAPRALRGMFEIPGRPKEYYVLLGPKGYEKETIVLAHWDARTGRLSKETELPSGFVAEGIAPIASDKILLVDDLKEAVLVATEN